MPNTPKVTKTNLDTTDTDKKAPLPVKGCNKFGQSCLFCKQGTPHPSPQESDWSDEDWHGTHTKAWKETGESNLLSDWDLPKPQSEPTLKIEVDKLDIDKVHLEQDNPKEEQIEVTNLLIPLPTTGKGEEKATTWESMEELTEVEKKYQQEDMKCVLHEKIYMDQLSEEEESDTGSEYSGYSYFD